MPSIKGGALQSDMEELHRGLAKALKTALENKPNAAVLQCIRQFVRDVGITPGLRAADGTVEELEAELDEIGAADFPKDFPRSEYPVH